MWVLSLDWEDSLGEGMATHSSILAFRILMDRGTWWATVHGVAKSQTPYRLIIRVHPYHEPRSGWCISSLDLP